jgi:hypothetical protein
MVYDHDFYMLDNQPTGPAMSVRFPFEGKPSVPPQNDARIDGNQLTFGRELKTGEIVQFDILGSSNKVSDYDLHIENSQTGAGVEQTSDSPLAALHLWSIAPPSALRPTSTSTFRPAKRHTGRSTTASTPNETRTPKMAALRCACLLAWATLGFYAANLAAQASTQTPAVDSDCSKAAQTTAPHAEISNGQVNAVVYLPDANNGYYRASRFDWSGSVACLAYKGHTYFGKWFGRYDPLINDAITGPVEEFRAADGNSAPFYDGAKPGGLFVKPGVGLLRRLDAKPFDFKVRYPIVDGGKWTIHTSKQAVSFRQELKKTPIGVAYVYTKTLKLDKNAPVLALVHTLKNTGTKTIEFEVYEHDFYMLDNEPTGPAISVRFPFDGRAAQPLQNDGRIDGKQLIYGRELTGGQQVQSDILGSSNQVSDYDLHIENSRTGAGVEQSADVPLALLHLWSIRSTVCPEAYIHITIPPGQTAHWTIRYRFYTK